mgnify:CR=1 FL=1
MSDQGKFIEALDAVKNIAVSQNNSLTKEEIKKYLSDMNLSEEQFEQVYYYLSLSGINIEGYRFIPKAVDLRSENKNQKDEEETSVKPDEKSKEQDKKENGTDEKALSKKRAEYNSRIYMDEIKKLDYYEDNDEKKLVSEFLNGDKEARNKFIENRLTQVINNANKYRNEKLPIAEADADQILQEAEATKQERINDANAQVAMFNAKFEEYEKNPEVTKKRMFYEAMEGILPQLRVIIDGTDSTTTMLHEQLNSVSEQNVQSSASPADSSSTSK